VTAKRHAFFFLFFAKKQENTLSLFHKHFKEKRKRKLFSWFFFSPFP